ncbi:DMT family transporter [Gluconacetobacter azotocaptans]|uniref:DMT family transporter n=1 Tax=Gluconacetobacter azotocaptans TaxID=142834 RepID=UPI00195A2EA3|nr:DMT family transporter [Gluconacetobacter azotocaptans]MBM9400817.1 DMT family transporter [Gluconacetobacter azotocaptans]
MQYTSLLFVSLLWGSSFVLIRTASHEVTAYALAMDRTVVAGAFLLTLATIRGVSPPVGVSIWRRLFLLSLVGQICPFVLLAIAGHLTSSVNLAFMMGTAPLATFVMSAVVPPKEEWSGMTLAGLALGACGVAISFHAPRANIASATGSSALNMLGQLAAFGAAVSYAGGALVSRDLSAKIDSFAVVTYSMCLSAILMVLCAFFQHVIVHDPVVLPHSFLTIMTLLILGIFNTGIAYAVYFRLIHQAGATFAGLNNYLVPPIGVIFGGIILHESISPTIWLSLALVLIGVVLVRTSQLIIRSRNTTSNLSAN